MSFAAASSAGHARGCAPRSGKAHPASFAAAAKTGYAWSDVPRASPDRAEVECRYPARWPFLYRKTPRMKSTAAPPTAPPTIGPSLVPDPEDDTSVDSTVITAERGRGVCVVGLSVGEPTPANEVEEAVLDVGAELGEDVVKTFFGARDGGVETVTGIGEGVGIAVAPVSNKTAEKSS